MRHLSCLLLSMTLCGMMTLPAPGQDKKDAKDQGKPADKGPALFAPGPAFKHCDGRRIVFVANGVCDSQLASDHLGEANADLGAGLHIYPIRWCRTDCCYHDMADCEAHMMAAHRIAQATIAIRRDAPKAQIFYVGHSAGARIVLAAAEMAGPNSVDRIFLLHAAVNSCYDLRQALRASRYGIDSFAAPDDLVLETAGLRYVLADGTRGQAAGRSGFAPPQEKKDLELYRNLRQYRWTQDWCGQGGHLAWTLTHNLRKGVMPLILHTPAGEPVPPPVKLEPKKMPEAS